MSALRRLGGLLGRRPWLLTAGLGGLVVLFGVNGADLPAQLYRTWLFRTYGALLWDDHWYAGHSLAGYSLLFPPLAAVVGPLTVGVLSCTASTAALTRLVRGRARHGHELGLVWFAVITVVDLMVGRLPFALGLALGIAALAAARERRWLLAALAALGAGLASPLDGAFVLLAAVSWLPTAGWRRVLPLAAAGSGPAAALLFGESSGRFPYPAGTLATVLVFVAIGLALAPQRPAVIRHGLMVYGAAAVALFLIPNPVGGNIVRLGGVAAGPLAALVLMRTGRVRTLSVLAAPLLLWQLEPVPAAVAAGATDLSSRSAYYTGVLHYLTTHGGADTRVEIPLTRDHWETAYVAPYVPLARGWERQTDLAVNPLFYAPTLTGTGYRSWLVTNGVRYVALPDVPLDSSAIAEAGLLRAGQSYLRSVWSDSHWKVWRVVGARPMVEGGQLVTLGHSYFEVREPAAGFSTVLVHWTPLWVVTSGNACVLSDGNGWTLLYAASPGTVTVSARFQLSRLAAGPQSVSCAATSG